MLPPFPVALWPTSSHPTGHLPFPYTRYQLVALFERIQLSHKSETIAHRENVVHFLFL